MNPVFTPKQANLALILVFAILFSLSASSSYVTIQSYGAPFDVNEEISLFGSLSGTNSDLNIYARNSSGTDLNQVYLGSQNSSYKTRLSIGRAGDYNITVTDLNSNVSTSMLMRVTRISRVAINWDNLSMKPPFDVSTQGGSDFRATFTAYNSSDANIGSGTDLNVEIYNQAGTLQDSNNGVTNGDGNVQLTLTLPSSAGEYYLLVNRGAAAFPFPIYSFKMQSSIKNPDTNSFQDSFKPSSTALLSIDVTNYAGTQYLGSATVSATISDSSGGLLSTLSLSGSGGTYSSAFTAPSTQGTYYITISASYGGTTQTQKMSFSVQNYKLNFFATKYSGGGMGEKEEMPSIYPTSTNISMEAHILDLNSEVGELSGNSLNYICDNNNDSNRLNHNFTIKHRQMGRRDWNSTLGRIDVNSTKTTTYCQISFRGPAAAGVWEVQLEANDLNVLGSTLDLTEHSIIIVQDYFVFLEPVDPTSCDTTATDVAGSCGFKFSFTKGQKIGLKPKVIDMKNTGSTAAVSRITGARLFSQSGETSLSYPTDLNFNKDLNLVTIDTNSTAFGSISGGFYPGGFFVDINTAAGGTVQRNVTAFGFFNMRVLNATLTFVDLNGTSVATHGPPTYSNDYNTYIQVSVLDSDGTTAIQGAKVSLGRLMNFEARTQYDTSAIDANYTNSSGVATIVIDKGTLSLESGQYELMVDINAPSVGKTDSLEGMFERRSFFMNAFPFDNSKCMGVMMISGDENISFVAQANDPFGWNSLSDINITSAAVYYEGSVTKPLDTPKQMPVILTPNKALSCRNTNYAAIDVNHNGRWDNGFYRAILTVRSNSKGTQTINAFFKVQPFSIIAIPNAAGQMSKASSYAEPGAQWDFNISTRTDVNLTVKLINVENWSVFSSDVNIHRHSDGNWLNNPNYGGTDVTGNGQWQTIDVNIPSNLPLAEEIERGGYVLEIDANNGSATATAELFVIPIKWQLFAAKELQGQWTQGMPGPYSFDATGNSPTMFIDSNVVDDCNASGLAEYGRSHRREDVNTMGLTYDRIIKPAGSGLGVATDFNRFVLVDTTNKRAYIDYDDDCNWADTADRNTLVIGSYAPGLTTVRSYTACQPGVGCQDAQNPYNGVPVITNINKSKLSYVTTGVLRDLNSESVTNFDPFMGEMETDVNIGIPVVVKTLSDQPVNGATVSVYTVMKAEMGGGTPQTLSYPADYSRVNDATDGNGLAVPLVVFNEPGIYMIGLKITNGSTTQTVMPWNGVVVKTGGFSTTVSFGLRDLNIVYDTNLNSLSNWDINRTTITQACFDENTTLIGFFSERLRGVNLDNDVVYSGNNYSSLMMDENWVFVPLTGNCPGALAGKRLLIDDDLSLNPTVDDSLESWPKGAAGNNQDLNEIIVTSAADFNASGLCLYGSGRCSPSANENSNFGAIYDLNTVDSNILDGNFLMYNYFTNNKFFEPSIMSGNSGIARYMRFDIKDYDTQYVSGSATVTGAIYSESTSAVVATVSGTITNGIGRLPISSALNTTIGAERGTGYIYTLDVTYGGETAKAMGWVESNWR